MEEIWKDMNFSSLQGDGDHHHHHTTRELESIPPPPPPPHNPNTSFCQHRNTFRARGTNLQEFLARPFDREPTSSCLGTSSMSSTDFCQFGPSAAAAAPPLTSLCLNNSGPYQFHYFDNSGALHGPQPSHSITTTTTTTTTNDVGSSSFDASMGSHPYDAFVSSAAFPAFCNKRGSESEENTVDRRCKRMIKNRESAARSRARRQSYTHELENQVAVLTEQNEKLVEQRQQLYLALAVQVPKKRTLQRSSTAPF